MKYFIQAVSFFLIGKHKHTKHSYSKLLILSQCWWKLEPVQMTNAVGSRLYELQKITVSIPQRPKCNFPLLCGLLCCLRCPGRDCLLESFCCSNELPVCLHANISRGTHLVILPCHVIDVLSLSAGKRSIGMVESILWPSILWEWMCVNTSRPSLSTNKQNLLKHKYKSHMRHWHRFSSRWRLQVYS